MNSPAITTTNLTKRYGESLALDGLDLEVKRGEVYGFLGPNGAGKSTTINLLMSYCTPTAGTAQVLGYDPWESVVDCHQRVGILPDGFSVYGDRSAREHLELVIETKQTTDEPSSLLTQVGLADAIDKPAGDFSQGMKQRLALAMSLVGDPELLILDEPFTGLDPHGVGLVRDVVSEKTDAGTTVFFSSHVLNQVELVCDRIGILAAGQLVKEGTPAALREQAGLSADATVEDIFVEHTAPAAQEGAQ